MDDRALAVILCVGGTLVHGREHLGRRETGDACGRVLHGRTGKVESIAGLYACRYLMERGEVAGPGAWVRDGQDVVAGRTWAILGSVR